MTSVSTTLFSFLISLLFILSIYFLALEITRNSKNINPKPSRFIIYIFLVCIICTYPILHWLIFIRAGNLAVRRSAAMKGLKEACISQQQFSRLNGRYAKTFKELGYASGGKVLHNSSYVFLLANDKICPREDCKLILPIWLRRDDYHIFAIDQYGGEYDILSTDFNCKMEIYQSFDIWPLPEPKWHEFK